MKLASLAVIAALVAGPALAIEFTKPDPIDDVVPQRKGECIKGDEVEKWMTEGVAHQGGIAFRLNQKAAQLFSDIWRKGAGAPAVKVSEGFAWLQVAAVFAELDERGCLATLSDMSLEQYGEIIEKLPRKPGPGTDL